MNHKIPDNAEALVFIVLVPCLVAFVCQYGIFWTVKAS